MLPQRTPLVVSDIGEYAVLQLLLAGLQRVEVGGRLLVVGHEPAQIGAVAHVLDALRRLRVRLGHVRAGEGGHFVAGDETPEVLGGLDHSVNVVLVALEPHLDRLAFADVRVEHAPCEPGDGHVMRDLRQVVIRRD